MNDRQYCRLGMEKSDHQPDDVWELVINDFLQPIDPNKYFVTSGDAVQKTKRLVQDIKEMQERASKLLKLLKKAKGAATYLETEWSPIHGLTLKKKDPRSKKKEKHK